MTASAILCKLSTESQRISKKTGFPGGLDSKVSACNVRDLDSIPGLGRSPGGHGNPLQYACLENPHGQRSLAGYSPWGRKESDTTERLHTVMGKNTYAVFPIPDLLT